MDDMPNMAGIERLLEENGTPEQRLLSKIEDKGDALEYASNRLWEHCNVEDYQGVKEWHRVALEVANAAQQYAAEVGRLLDLVGAKTPVEGE